MTAFDRRRFLAMVGAGVIGTGSALAGCASVDGERATSEPSDAAPSGSPLAGIAVSVRRDPGCDCCSTWVDYLRSSGATVDETEDPARDRYRRSVGVPDPAASCHTAAIDGYAIEGHVPAEAIRKLLDERPDAAGLALPGMPADSPGMGGDATSWANQQVVLVNRDGTIDRYSY